MNTEIKNTKKNPARSHAEADFLQKLALTQEMLQELNTKLAKLCQYQDQNHKSWGSSGSLGYVNEKLSEVISFLN